MEHLQNINYVSKFWDKITQLFKEAEQSSASNPIVHEVMTFSRNFKEDYDFWRNTLVLRKLVNWLSDQYSLYVVNPEAPLNTLDFLNGQSTKGFVIHFQQMGYSTRDAQFFAFWLKEKIRTLPYRLQIADRRTFAGDSTSVETIERFYIKPNKKLIPGEKIDQYFGNISIELTLKNDAPAQLFLKSTVYPDRIYKKGYGLEALMQHIL